MTKAKKQSKSVPMNNFFTVNVINVQA